MGDNWQFVFEINPNSSKNSKNSPSSSLKNSPAPLTSTKSTPTPVLSPKTSKNSKSWKFMGSKSKVHKVGVHFDKHSQYLGNWKGTTTKQTKSRLKTPNTMQQQMVKVKKTNSSGITKSDLYSNTSSPFDNNISKHHLTRRNPHLLSTPAPLQEHLSSPMNYQNTIQPISSGKPTPLYKSYSVDSTVHSNISAPSDNELLELLDYSESSLKNEQKFPSSSSSFMQTQNSMDNFYNDNNHQIQNHSTTIYFNEESNQSNFHNNSPQRSIQQPDRVYFNEESPNSNPTRTKRNYYNNESIQSNQQQHSNNNSYINYDNSYPEQSNIQYSHKDVLQQCHYENPSLSYQSSNNSPNNSYNIHQQQQSRNMYYTENIPQHVYSNNQHSNNTQKIYFNDESISTNPNITYRNTHDNNNNRNTISTIQPSQIYFNEETHSTNPNISYRNNDKTTSTIHPTDIYFNEETFTSYPTQQNTNETTFTYFNNEHLDSNVTLYNDNRESSYQINQMYNQTNNVEQYTNELLPHSHNNNNNTKDNNNNNNINTNNRILPQALSRQQTM